MSQGNKTNHKKIQFCKRGHDTFVCGRAKNRSCKDCIREDAAKRYIPHPQQPKQFCPKGHDTFIVGRSKYKICKECIREYSRENYDSEYKKKYKLENKDKIKLKDKEYQKKNKDRIRDKILKRRFGIGIVDYNKLFKEQNEKCAICDRHQSVFTKAFSIDHNHKTNKVRGLLCMDCNILLGNAKESFKILKNAIKYLEFYGGIK